MAETDGWKHDDEGWYAGDDADPAADEPAAANPYRALPPRTPLEDIVAEVDTSAPPEEPPGDPNRKDAIRLGLMGGAG